MTVWVLDPEVHDLGEMGECYSLAWNDEGKSHISFPQGPFDEDEFWSRVQEGDKVYWVESIESDSIYPEYASVYLYDHRGILIADVTEAWNNGDE
jgi:hypothetical protein